MKKDCSEFLSLASATILSWLWTARHLLHYESWLLRPTDYGLTGSALINLPLSLVLSLLGLSLSLLIVLVAFMLATAAIILGLCGLITKTLLRPFSRMLESTGSQT